jgi:hypothetical protein
VIWLQWQAFLSVVHLNTIKAKNGQQMTNANIMTRSGEKYVCFPRRRRLRQIVVLGMVVAARVAHLSIWMGGATMRQIIADQPQQHHHRHDMDKNIRGNFRFLFGIFSMDSPIEQIRRQTHRETYLSYYKLHLGNHTRQDTICSLSELIGNQDFINDRTKCQFVYTFVIGGGDPENSPARCFWGDTVCSGTSPSDMTLAQPNAKFSHAAEYFKYNDITLLNIRENQHDGKSETWFSYVSALITVERPDLGVDFVGRLDSDAIIGVELLLNHYKRDAERFQNDSNPYLFGGGDYIDADFCFRTWRTCKRPEFIAPGFFGGGMMILSSPLARHAYLDGTVLERMEISTKARLPEDLLTANFAFRDPNITVRVVPLIKEEHAYIFVHDYKEPAEFANEYWSIIGLDKALEEKWNQTLSVWS